MTGRTWFSWVIVAVAALFFIVPLIGTFEFSLRAVRDHYSFEAYNTVFVSPEFQEAFLRSVVMALLTIVLGVALIVPTALLVRLRFPGLRAPVDFVTLLPLVIPALVIAFGYVRMYNSSSVLPLTDSALSTDLLLTFGYVALVLPYMYRSIDTALRAIDVKTLTEAGQCLGAGPLTILLRIILPNVRTGVLGGAFIAFAVVIGEFTISSTLNRPTFAVYMQRYGANRAYEPAALAIMSFALVWACIGLLQLIGRSSHTDPAK